MNDGAATVQPEDPMAWNSCTRLHVPISLLVPVSILLPSYTGG
jgi:hypothetical protein